MTGVCWGEASPSETPITWSIWKKTEGGAPVVVIGDPDWGSLQVLRPCSSTVIDTGDATNKIISVDPNKYGLGDESLWWYIRGSTVPFDQMDATRTWEVYTGPVAKRWRYVQIKVGPIPTTTSTTTSTSTTTTSTSTFLIDDDNDADHYDLLDKLHNYYDADDDNLDHYDYCSTVR